MEKKIINAFLVQKIIIEFLMIIVAFVNKIMWILIILAIIATSLIVLIVQI